MKNETKGKLVFVLGTALIGVGLGLAYPPLVYIFFGVLFIIASFGYDKK